MVRFDVETQVPHQGLIDQDLNLSPEMVLVKRINMQTLLHEEADILNPL